MKTAFGILTGILLLATSAAQGSEPAKGKTYAVKAYRDLTYWQIRQDPDRDRHQLDVYRPKGLTNCPVLFFVHGGAWTISSKNDVLGIFGYGTIGKCLAERGQVVVMPNYRLSPHVRHPEHINDVARAFAWTCQNVADYGGDPERIIVVGHSAGGQLVTLLATDPEYLKEVARSPRDIQGVIGISGVYNLKDLDLKQLLGTPCKCLDYPSCVNPITSVFGPKARGAETGLAALSRAAGLAALPANQRRPRLLSATQDDEGVRRRFEGQWLRRANQSASLADA